MLGIMTLKSNGVTMSTVCLFLLDICNDRELLLKRFANRLPPIKERSWIQRILIL